MKHFILLTAPPTPEIDLPDIVVPSNVGFADVLNHWVSMGVSVFNSLFELQLVPGVSVGWFIVAVFVLTVAIEMLYGKIIK